MLPTHPDGKRSVSQETRKKISIATKGKPDTKTEEGKKRISEATKRNRPFYKIPLTEDGRKRKSEFMRNYAIENNIVQNFQKFWAENKDTFVRKKGYKRPKEVGDKISAALLETAASGRRVYKFDSNKSLVEEIKSMKQLDVRLGFCKGSMRQKFAKNKIYEKDGFYYSTDRNAFL